MKWAWRRPRRARGQEGFTLVEVLVTAGLALMGFVAVTNLQVSSMRGLANARDTTTAVQMAEHFIEQIRAESLQCVVGSGSTNCNFVPLVQGLGEWLPHGPASDAMVAPGAISENDYDLGLSTELPSTLRRNYCIQYRNSWVIFGSLMRSEVRVLWPRFDTNMEIFQTCDTSLVPDASSGDAVNVGLVTVSTTMWVGEF